MFDNLRESASSFYDEEPNEGYSESEAKPVAQRRQRRNARFLGMTAQQRFFLAVMLFLTVCVMGVLAMFVTQRMFLPF